LRSATKSFLILIRSINKLKLKPGFAEFAKLARKGNAVPVYAEMTGDLDTPVSAYLKTNPGYTGFLLESVDGGLTQARYSFIGVEPKRFIVSDHNGTRLTDGDRVIDRFGKLDPLDALKKVLGEYQYVASPDLPRFCGGAVGFLGYDANRIFERLPEMKGKMQYPVLSFAIAEDLVIFDHVKRRMTLVANAVIQKGKGAAHVEAVRRAYDDAAGRIARMRERLESRSLSVPGPVSAKSSSPIVSNFSKEGFKKAIRKAKEHIRIGDIFQIVISQRFTRKTAVHPFNLYRALRSVNPSPYMFFLSCGGFHLVGSSPEVHVRCEEGVVELRPIAGTRRRGKTDEEDRALAAELLKDKKELAEHVMLVDLGRNDLGRVCDTGSVKVSEFMVIERYSHVMHIVSHVKGLLKKGFDAFDVIRATFPAGTVSGAPKIRAMELIARMEPHHRGPYAGMVGYFSFSGNFDSCITIRTAVVENGQVWVQAGAGVVLDSDPEFEWEESRNKAKGVFAALDQAERGLE
jgi:anthranilate synthase component 1